MRLYGAVDEIPGAFASGKVYVQDASAKLAAMAAGVRPGMRVLDTCAAPGGKTSQLAEALQGQGLLLANEFVAARAEILRQNLERMGVTNAVITNEDTANLAKALPGVFDRVLVDAPCSGEGMFRKEPVAATQHNNALVEHCAALGAEILENAAAMLAPGGVLVYSTCTFAPQEDEAQIAAFLARHPEFTLCDLNACGFGRPGEENRAPDCTDITRCRRIWPADGGEGHFMAKLKKSPDAEAPVPVRVKPGKPAKTPPEWLDFVKTTFPFLADRPLTTAGDWLLLPVPGSELLNLSKLRIVRGGVLAGSVLKKRFQPAHALFMAYGAQCTNREELTLTDPHTAAWLRGDEIDAATGKIVSYDYDAENYTPSQSTNTNANVKISEATAKQIALSSVPGATAANIYKFKLDFDDGRWEYEGEIRYGTMEYDFTIDANTGAIIEWDMESIYD